MVDKTDWEKYKFLTQTLGSGNFTVSELFRLLEIRKTRYMDDIDKRYINYLYDKVRTVIKRIP